jgi:hypothetical protein
MTRRDDPVSLDRALDEIRSEPVDAEAMRQAADRVRARLHAASAPETAAEHALDGCPGYQALFPAYLRGEASPSRVLLLEDHVRECVACRKALKEARSPRPVSTLDLASARGSRTARTARWAAAAVLVIGAGLAAYGLRDRLLPPAFAATAEVRSIDGTLYRVDRGAMRALAVGDTIRRGESIRAGRDSGAVVRLADGSDVEMRERSELSLSREGDGVAIDLAMGSVIVQAAPQGRGHLYVRSDDCLVSVQGTIFTVNHDLKGSKVSVVEGLVEVRFGEEAFRLQQGEQVATSPSLEKTSVESEISWSRDFDRYVALLRELRSLQKTMDAEVTRPGLRHSTRLLDLAPHGTVFYAAVPNVSASLVEARRVLRDKVAASPVLLEWWTSKVAPLGGEAAVDDALDRLRAVGGELGDEIVITFQKSAGGDVHSPVVLAEVRNPDALRAAIAGEIDRIAAQTGGRGFGRVLTEEEVSGIVPIPKEARGAMLFRVEGDLLAASPDLDAIRRVGGTAPGSIAGSSFHGRLSDAYRDGASWLLGVDLHAILEDPSLNREKLQPTGVLDAEHLIVEATEEEGRLRDSAVLTFDQPRRGVASWLASPGPMGSLRFISPEASLAAAFVVKDPAAMVEDAYGLLRASDPAFDRNLADVQRTTGIDVLRDLAAPLGGEIAFALDGPVLPVPAWKLVAEVHDPSRLESTIERLVARANDAIRNEGGDGVAGLSVVEEQVGDRTFFVLRAERPKLEVHYVFVDGYLIAAPQRVLLERAMQQRDSRYDLASSPKFTALLPRDARTSFSAIAYQDVGSLTGSIARGIAGATEGLTPEQQRTLDEFAADSPAGLAYAYAERDRIVFGGGRSGGIVSLLGSLLGLEHPQALHEVLGELRRAEAAGPTTR